jgi:hypothetical protein
MDLDFDFLFNEFNDNICMELNKRDKTGISEDSETIAITTDEEFPSDRDRTTTNIKEKKSNYHQSRKDVVSSTKNG